MSKAKIYLQRAAGFLQEISAFLMMLAGTILFLLFFWSSSFSAMATVVLLLYFSALINIGIALLVLNIRVNGWYTAERKKETRETSGQKRAIAGQRIAIIVLNGVFISISLALSSLLLSVRNFDGTILLSLFLFGLTMPASAVIVLTAVSMRLDRNENNQRGL